MKRATLIAALLALSASTLALAAASPRADPRSDAPEQRFTETPELKPAASYAEALQNWLDADDINAWIAHHFHYDLARALRLSETQRQQGARLPIHSPEQFFAAPQGVCVDLARFAVETLQRIAPESRPQYLMIEFNPVQISGQTLRRHWLVGIERHGQRWYFADSKRPGHLAGPYADTAAFIADYGRYRGREVVAWQERASYERQQRTLAQRQPRQDRQAAAEHKDAP